MFDRQDGVRDEPHRPGCDGQRLRPPRPPFRRLRLPPTPIAAGARLPQGLSGPGSPARACGRPAPGAMGPWSKPRNP